MSLDTQHVPSLAGTATLDVGADDVAVAGLTFALSAALCGWATVAVEPFPCVLLLHLGVTAIPAGFFALRLRRAGELAMPLMLTVATFASGPIGAFGCAAVGYVLRRRRPTPERLADWYDYICGVAERDRATTLHDEISSGRLPPDPAAAVHHFAPVVSGRSIGEQQRVLGVLGRHYHGDFRPMLRRALRHRNGLVRAQAAAIASRLDRDEKTLLWSNVREDVGSEANGSPS
jgi:hypothetical protein